MASISGCSDDCGSRGTKDSRGGSGDGSGSGDGGGGGGNGGSEEEEGWDRRMFKGGNTR